MPELDFGPIHDEEDPQLGHLIGLTQIPDSFKNCFRMTSSNFEWLSSLLKLLLECCDHAVADWDLIPGGGGSGGHVSSGGGGGKEVFEEVYAREDFRVVESKSKSSYGGATLF